MTGEFPAQKVIGEFPGQKASNAENVSIWSRHHVDTKYFSELFDYILERFIVTCCHSFNNKNPVASNKRSQLQNEQLIDQLSTNISVTFQNSQTTVFVERHTQAQER